MVLFELNSKCIFLSTDPVCFVKLTLWLNGRGKLLERVESCVPGLLIGLDWTGLADIDNEWMDEWMRMMKSAFVVIGYCEGGVQPDSVLYWLCCGSFRYKGRDGDRGDGI